MASEQRSEGSQDSTSRIDGLELLRRQHEHIRELFIRADADLEAFNQLVDALALHLELEERCFYPLLDQIGLDEEMHESVEEHLSCKRILADLVETAPDDASWLAKIRVLERQVEMHFDEEEGEVLPQVERMIDADQRRQIGEQMMAFVAALAAESEDAALEQVLAHTTAPPV